MTAWIFAPLALALASGSFAPQQAGSEPLSPELEARVQKLGKELRCAVCQGLSVTDSPASMARAQLDKVRQLVAEGKSDQEVKDYFVERYGEWVLLRPKPEGVNLLVWLGPGILILAGLAIIFRLVAAGAKSPEPTHVAEAKPTPAGAPPSSDPYLNAVRAELER